MANGYAIEHPDVTTTNIGMSKMKNTENNIKVLGFQIPDGLLHEIEKIIKPVKNKMRFEGNPETNISKIII